MGNPEKNEPPPPYNDEASDQEVGQTNGDGKKLPFPKQVFFIVGNEFCERFSYYGMKAILVIYFKSKLHFNEDKATSIYHIFSLFCYFTPLFGAIIADQFLGKFRTIIWISLLYILGHVFKTIAAITPLNLPPVEFSMVGLALIALGTGGIKPCVAAFGGDQFKLPEQELQLQRFFSIFYMSINLGSMISTFVTPILRSDVHCYGSNDCFALAFGVPAALMAVATIILIMGRPFYTMKPCEGNILGKFVGAIFYSLRRICRRSNKNDHWMEVAKEKYDSELVEDTKAVLRVLVLYLPLPVFWALFDQQGSRWTFQANRMNGELGSNYVIKPDQFQIINPLLILVLIPFFQAVVYPMLAKCKLLVRPLERIFVGGLLAAGAFVISGLIELKLQESYEIFPEANSSNVHFMNTLNCRLNVVVLNSSNIETQNFTIEPHLNYIAYNLNSGSYKFKVEAAQSNESSLSCNFVGENRSLDVDLKDGTVSAILALGVGTNEFTVYQGLLPEDPTKSEDTYPKVRVFVNSGVKDNPFITIKRDDGNSELTLNPLNLQDDFVESAYKTLKSGDYQVYLDNDTLVQDANLSFKIGGVYTVVLSGSGKNLTVTSHELTKPNNLHMLWLVPQYFVITCAEVMVSVTGLEFSYTHAPAAMKSVVQAAWLWTVAFGNLIVAIVAEYRTLTQTAEFFMFATLMAVDMIIFGGLAIWFTRSEAARKRGIDNPAASSATTPSDNIPLDERKSTKKD